MSKQEDYEGFKWIKVKKYKENLDLPADARYKLLEEHHIEETSFLIEEVRKLDKEIDELTI